jgi:hypothetical protein
MWSKTGRFVEGLHAAGGILAKISVNCVINYMLHYYLRVISMGLSYVWFITVFIFMGIACVCLLLFQYESVHLHNVFVCLRFIYKVPQYFYVYMF